MRRVFHGKWGKGMILVLILWLIAVVTVIVMTLSRPASAGTGLRPVYRVDRNERVIALTFDAAWDDETTDAVLEILDAAGVRATFFFVGTFAQKYPETVVKIHNRGHEVANHSMTHKDPTSLSDEELFLEISACGEVLTSLTGVVPTLYRAPSGAWEERTVETARSLGYTTVQWSADSVDWRDPEPDVIVRRIEKNACPGGILLFHLGKENTVKALPTILRDLMSDGYTFVTVSDLLLDGETYVDPAGVQRAR